ncbi:MAG TPA: DUF4249 domain-containing protein [Flavobacteriales bacterium]|nr:DUF4249 domain-containing protein [Flavobacteriales bacterium]HMR27262.1 DUF4249 domain-containing protein [Flavobacteriales bacterium]
MKNHTLPFLLPAALVLLLSACEKEITVDVPETEPRLVVEGTIEPGEPPIIILTRTQSFFDPTDLSSFASIFVKNATVIVSNGLVADTLDMICSSILTEDQILLAAEVTGLDPQLLANIDICLYSTTNTAIYGEEGGVYDLRVEAEGKTLTSTTTIVPAVPLDSLWFQLIDQDGSDGDDSTGFLWARSFDPPAPNNYYRVMTRRLNLGDDGTALDATFAAPLGSTSNDQYFNGQAIEFIISRGSSSFSDPEDRGSTFKRGDTVAVKLISLDKASYDFYRSYESNVATQGDLFTQPANVRSNIEGGLGVWAGLHAYLDTLVCIP